MAWQDSAAVRNAMNDARESAWGASPKIRLYTGAAPANCATAPTGTLLWEAAMPADALTASSVGTKTLTAPASAAAVAAGTIGYARIYDSAGATCHGQGTVTATGGGGDVTVDNTNVASGQTVTLNTFSITRANA